jgi:hypothetical protein
MDKKEIIQEREALIEMYKAGFLDGYKVKNKVKKKEDWNFMNKIYKLAFLKRFEKKINNELKKK